MQPTYQQIKINPGIVKETSRKAAEGFWYDGDKIRFRYGKPEKIGGWINVNGADPGTSFEGIARAIHNWNANDGSQYTGLGTHTHLYIWQNGAYYDITPIATSGTTAVNYTVSAGASTVLVSLAGHPFIMDDIVYFSTAVDGAGVTLGGNLLLADQYQVVSVVDTNSFYINVGASASIASAALSVSTNFYSLVHLGQLNTIIGTGWGAGSWGHSGGWSSPVSSAIQIAATNWTIDNWGEDLVANYRGGPIFTWVENSGVDIRAVTISGSPARCDYILVSPEDRHLIAFGTNDIFTGEYDPVLVRWCDQENYNDWSPSATNTAGDKRFSGASKITGAIRARGQILIWTEDALYGMQHVGAPFIFSFQVLGENCGLIGPHAAVEVNGKTYWMANQRFMVYDGGSPRPLECTVLRYIFDNIDRNQYDKVYAGVNGAYNEIIWLYQEDGADEVNKYVIYNYVENHWTIGSIDRTVWADDSTYSYPVAADTLGNLYFHEYGSDANGEPIYSFVESADFDLQDGQQIVFINRIMPDFTNRDGSALQGNITMTLFGRKTPGSSEVITKGPYVVSAETKYVDYRHRARQVSFKVEASSTDEAWRMGEIKFRMAPDGEA